MLVIGIFILLIAQLPLITGDSYQYETQSSRTTSIRYEEPHEPRDYSGYEVVGKSTAQGGLHRALVYFDMSYIPSDANITEAKIWVWGNTYNHYDVLNVRIHRITRVWSAGSATWVIAGAPYGQSAWYTPGGDYNATILDNRSWTTTNLTFRWIDFNITNTTKSFVNGTLSNYGFLLRDDAEFHWNRLMFCSDCYSPSMYRPKLIVNYTLAGSASLYNITLTKTIWNFKGYPNSTTKASNVLYSEIPNCSAVVGKNLTSDYWYTYSPSLGLLENWDIGFGEGLFITVSNNSTWRTLTNSTSTDIIPDIWVPLVYSSPNLQNVSDVHYKITFCVAVTGKNATTGYWYTYWPDVGLLEDEYLSFGDGLFILVSQNTTWDHT